MTPPDRERLDFEEVETPAYVIQRIFDRLDDIEGKVDGLGDRVKSVENRLDSIERSKRCWQKVKAKLWRCTTDLLSNWRIWAAAGLLLLLDGVSRNETLAKLLAALLGVEL